MAGCNERKTIGPLHDRVTWYKITHAGEQVAQWDFQNKGRSRWTGTSCFVLEVPLCNLLTSMSDFVRCDRIVQRAYYTSLLQTQGQKAGLAAFKLTTHFRADVLTM